MDVPRTMKAAVLYGQGDLRVVERPVPTPGYGEALLRVEAIAICGSDPAIIAHGFPFQPPMGEYIPGHEFTGTVVRVAPDVSEVRVGDRVAIEPHKGCGRCENCIRGLYTTCLNYGKNEKGHRHYGWSSNGGYAEYAAIHVNSLHKLPDSVSFEEGTLLTTAGTVLYGYERLGWIKPGETVAVIGPGAIGILAAQMAKLLGAGRVILSGTRDERLRVGRQLGADVTLNVHQVNVTEAVLELTSGLGADVVVEASGNPEAAAQALEIVRKNGRLSFTGLYHQSVNLPLDKIVQGNLLVTAPKAEGMWNLERALPLLADCRLNVKPLVTHTFPLDEINAAFRTFVEREGGAIKVVVKP